MSQTIAVLTGGGDCPGPNAAIRAVVKTGIVRHGYRVLGIEEGFDGLVKASKPRSLAAPGRGASSTAPIRPRLRQSITLGRAFREWIASAKYGDSVAAFSKSFSSSYVSSAATPAAQASGWPE